jgi:hypothetical protein
MDYFVVAVVFFIAIVVWMVLRDQQFALPMKPCGCGARKRGLPCPYGPTERGCPFSQCPRVS